MRIVKSIALASVLAVSIAAPAAAAEFNGPFVGAQVGWQSEKMRDPDSSLGTVPVDDRKQSVTGGIYAGYDKRVADRVVVGAEAGLDFASDDEISGSGGGNSFTVDPKYSIDVTARAGYLVMPNTLVYARGGYTNARIRTTVTNAASVQGASDSQNGWLVGAGLERQFAPNTSVRLEYRYSKLSENNSKDDRNRVLGGLSYRF